MENETNKRNAIQSIREVEGEIKACFDGWDGAIKNKQQPVPIQDLDFWSNKLTQALKNLQETTTNNVNPTTGDITPEQAEELLQQAIMKQTKETCRK